MLANGERQDLSSTELNQMVSAVTTAGYILYNQSDSGEENKAGNTEEGAKSKESAKERRERQRREAAESKHGVPDYEEPASEDYAKWKAREAEKHGGKDARRRGHDEKQSGAGDRTKQQLDSDYDDPN